MERHANNRQVVGVIEEAQGMPLEPWKKCGYSVIGNKRLQTHANCIVWATGMDDKLANPTFAIREASRTVSI